MFACLSFSYLYNSLVNIAEGKITIHRCIYYYRTGELYYYAVHSIAYICVGVCMCVCVCVRVCVHACVCMYASTNLQLSAGYTVYGLLNKYRLH